MRLSISLVLLLAATWLLFNIGQAYRLSGDCKQAKIFYDSYQREEPNPKNAAQLEEAIALCTKQPDKPVDKPVDKPADKPADKPVETPVVTTPPPVVVAQTPERASPTQPVDTGEATTGGGLRNVSSVARAS